MSLSSLPFTNAPLRSSSRRARTSVGVSLASVALLASACGSDAVSSSASAADADAPTVIVTTNILGDVVQNIVGDQMNVETIMPVGADPHDFQPSAQQVAMIGDADVMIVNGAEFEEGLLDVIETAEADGVLTFEAIDAVDTLEFGEDSHGHDDEHDDEEHGDEDEHGDEEHEDEEHDDEEHDDEEHADDDHDEHGHDGADPHFFTDPARVAVAAGAIAEFLVDNVEGIDADAVTESANAYVAELNALDAEVEETLGELSEEQRVLVTNHEVFGYFAERYDFELIGTVIPAGSTSDGASAQDLVELAELITDEGVPAIFGETSASDELATTLAEEVGDISVIELFTESLGDADSAGATYVDMVRTNATRIADALGA